MSSSQKNYNGVKINSCDYKLNHEYNQIYPSVCMGNLGERSPFDIMMNSTNIPSQYHIPKMHGLNFHRGDPIYDPIGGIGGFG